MTDLANERMMVHMNDDSVKLRDPLQKCDQFTQNLISPSEYQILFWSEVCRAGCDIQSSIQYRLENENNKEKEEQKENG